MIFSNDVAGNCLDTKKLTKIVMFLSAQNLQINTIIQTSEIYIKHPCI